MLQFPDSFRWGAATASYQIEGAVHEDGRGESIWDRFCSTPGKIFNNENGAIACDHYHRYQEDIQLMGELGLQAYRFSVAWPRILPTGRGRVNPAGLDFYERLVDALLTANIEPFVTLFHWDLPQALQDDFGGWTSRDTAKAFVDYANIVSERLGDRVKNWITLNEPFVVAKVGYEYGVHAPGLHDPRLAWQVSHHLLLAHGMAVPVIRANSSNAQVGITLNLSSVHSATDSERDHYVAHLEDGVSNRWYIDPLFRGTYPSDIMDYLEQHNLTPQMVNGDAAIIAVPMDFLGVNNYSRTVVRQKAGAANGVAEQVRISGAEHTDMDWEVYPEGLREVLVRLHQEYHVPRLYVTENGAAFPDTVSANSRVHDARRENYYREYLTQAHAALSEGAPLAGYFAWSLMDNFEWSEGYSKRFGITYVDYATQRRIIKDSGYWYRNTIRAHGIREG
ncbi:MAG: beta-glucosidase [Ktedonobacteraceae bacterium]|nr:beta-glucosidase [Ktedonobacteraceae bacterium]